MEASPPNSPRPALNRRLLTAIPIGALVLIAGLQFILATRYGLSAWKGGGFGMFSTIDSPDARFLRIYLITPQGRLPAIPPAFVAKQSLRLQTLPSNVAAQDYAAELAQFQWMDAESLAARNLIPDQPANPFAPMPGARVAEALPPGIAPPPGAMPLSPDRVEVEVWHYRFDAGTGALHAEKLDQAEAAARSQEMPR